MAFDEDRYNEKLASWAMTPLAFYAIKGLLRHEGYSHTGLVRRDDGVDQLVVTSIGVSQLDQAGRYVGVTSHRRDDDAVEMLRDWAPRNTFFAAKPERPGTHFQRDPPQPPEPPEVTWEPTVLLVDGEAVAFEVCHFENGYWAAIGHLGEESVTIDSRGCPLSEVELVRLTDLLPLPQRPSRPPAPSVRFPDELLHEVPIKGPPLAEVDLLYRAGRYVTGTVGGESVSLDVGSTGHHMQLSGTAAGEALNAAYEGTHNDQPTVTASVEGDFAGQAAALKGVFRLQPDYWFVSGDVEGVVQDAAVQAHIRRAAGGISDCTSTIEATGTWQGSPFRLFASAPVGEAVLRGTVDGRPVHLDTTASRDRGATRITGYFDGPLALLLTAVIATLYFV